jgi:hypothetical protein
VLAGPAAATTTTPIPTTTDPNVLQLRPVLALVPPGQVSTQPADATPDALAAVASCDVNRIGTLAKIPATPANQLVPGACAVVGVAGPDKGYLYLGAAQLTKAGFGKQTPQDQVAIVVNGRVISNPAFQSVSFSGPIQITGNFTSAEAAKLAKSIDRAARGANAAANAPPVTRANVLQIRAVLALVPPGQVRVRGLPMPRLTPSPRSSRATRAGSRHLRRSRQRRRTSSCPARASSARCSAA